jgi:hypothetical protein
MTYTDEGISQLLSEAAAVNGEYVALLMQLYSGSSVNRVGDFGGS